MKVVINTLKATNRRRKKVVNAERKRERQTDRQTDRQRGRERQTEIEKNM